MINFCYLHKQKCLIAALLVVIQCFCIVIPAEAISYTYDAANRISSITFDQGETELFQFDNNGNMTGKGCDKPLTSPRAILLQVISTR